jgi:hypothetical protein
MKITILTKDGFVLCSVDAGNKIYDRKTNTYRIVDIWSRDWTCKKIDRTTYKIID